MTDTRFSRGRPLTGAEAEEVLCALMDELEETTTALALKRVEAAKAEAAYRRAAAQGQLSSGHKTELARTAHGLQSAGDLLDKRLITTAEADGLAELCRTRRAQLDSVRTVIASARAAEHGR